MNKQQFQKLVKKDRYQVFLFSSPVPLPLSYFRHTWFVTNDKGKINRWEIWNVKNAHVKDKGVLDHTRNSKGISQCFRNKCKTSWGHLHKNLFKPWKGRPKIPLTKKPTFNSKLMSVVEGKKGSNAEKMVKYINNSNKNYPYLIKYNYVFGPNCNTYIQRIIEKFPKSGFKLRWNALGKDYNSKKTQP